MTAREFLHALFAPYRGACGAGLRIDLRALAPDRRKPPWREWFPLSANGIEAAAYAAGRLAQYRDVYVGVLPRDPHGAPVEARWLWCDLDARGGSEDDVRATVRSWRRWALPSPRIVVASGSGGLHLYWPLAEPVPQDGDDTQVAFRTTLRRVCLAFNRQPEADPAGPHADLASAEPARVLRIPGTLNHKHSPPKSVTARISVASPALTLHEWQALLPPEPVPTLSRERGHLARSPCGLEARAPGERSLDRWSRTPIPEGRRHRELTSGAAWLVRDLRIAPELARRLLLQRARASPGRNAITEAEVEKMVEWACK